MVDVFQEMADSETELNNWWVENCKDSEKVSLHQRQSAIFELLEGIRACGYYGRKGKLLNSNGQNWHANKLTSVWKSLFFAWSREWCHWACAWVIMVTCQSYEKCYIGIFNPLCSPNSLIDKLNLVSYLHEFIFEVFDGIYGLTYTLTLSPNTHQIKAISCTIPPQIKW